MTKPPTRERFGLLGVAAAACVACCAGPLVAFLGGLSVAGLASTLFIGGFGFVIAIIAGASYVAIRHRRRLRGPTSGPSVMVDAPARKTPTR